MSTSRDNDEVRRLLIEQVPEITSGEVEIIGIAREVGQWAIIVVHAPVNGVDPVGACVGRRGERIKSITNGLGGGTIDIIRWSDSTEEYIRNLLLPLNVKHITFEDTTHRARVTVRADSVALKHANPIRLRLASRLAGWELELIEKTPE